MVGDFRKDDETVLEYVTFGILALMTALVLLSGVTNITLLIKHGKLKNFDLLFFYVFALLTLICKIPLIHVNLMH